jgi:hypothetical protein
MCRHYAKLNSDKLFVNADRRAKGFYQKQGFVEVNEPNNDTTFMSIQTKLPEDFIYQERVKRRHPKRSRPKMLEIEEKKE